MALDDSKAALWSHPFASNISMQTCICAHVCIGIYVSVYAAQTVCCFFLKFLLPTSRNMIKHMTKDVRFFIFPWCYSNLPVPLLRSLV